MARRSTKENPEPADRHFPVVGIGASAGGLKAIQAFFDCLPVESGMSFVVIVHLDPDYRSQMAELLQRHTKMPVSQPERPLRLQPNHVYVIPPDKDFALSDGHIRVTARDRSDRDRAPIDEFFRTLAATHASNAVAIVLSGTGSDGSQGIKSIRELGGLTMAQSPEEADFKDMPQNAIATGQIDFVLPVAGLAAEAVRLHRPERVRLPADPDELEETDEVVVGKIIGHVRARTGHDFSGYKRATLLRRLERRIQFTRSENISNYLRTLASTPDEARAFFNDVLITVSSFFRDPSAFEALEREVVPHIFAGANPDVGIRAWVAGCATGEEAYSLAMILCEYADKLDDAPNIQIFATDVHEKSFAFAREGRYPESIAADVSAARLERFFTKERGGYVVKKQIREKVLFANHDLLRDPPFLRLDLITCRNLLIYLESDAQHRVASLFHFGLRAGGFLLLGSSESIDDRSKLFTVADKKHRIFQPTTGSRTHRLETSLPRSWSSRKGVPTAPNPAIDRSPWALHQQLLEEYASPSLIVNSAGTVVHLSSRVGAYLKAHGGEPTDLLVEMVPQNLRARFRALLNKALIKGVPAEARGLDFDVSGKVRKVDVLVRPLDSGDRRQRSALVVFEEVSESSDRSRKSRPDSSGAEKSHPRGGRRASEVRALRAELQASLEEHEATLEEAQAANEELQSINEEQRATAEELETSKEELQSLNEELRTMNQEYRNQNEQLGQINADLGNLIDSTEIGTIFVDREFRVRRYTPAVVRVFNFVDSDRGRPLSDVTNRLQYPELMNDLRHVLQTLSRLEREVLADDGRWFAIRISPYRSMDDRIEGVVATLFDITARKQAEMEREKLLAEVQTASIAKSNFIGVMSHEFRTPLNAIVGYAGIVKAGTAGAVTPEQTRHLDRIAASAMHLAHMIDDTLEAARMEAGAEKVEQALVDVSFLVREVGEALEPVAMKRNLRLRLDVQDNLSTITDAGKLRQILFNLLANAVRYTDRGTITISATAEGDELIFVVTDTGIGIAAEHLEKIFERFWQVDQSMTRRRGGTGLGLMVSRGLARALAGEIEVKSILGSGSEFTLRLPLVRKRPLPDSFLISPDPGLSGVEA